MTWLKGREIFFIEAWHFGALILWFLINLQLRRRGEKSPLLKRYFQVQICLLIFIISKILKTISPVIELRWFFIVTQYAGITLLGPSFLFFAFIYTHHREFPRRGRRILYLVSSSFFLAVALNPLHHRFYLTFDFYRDTFGPLFYYMSFFNYSLILVSIVLSFRGFRRRNNRRTDGVIALSALVPLIVNILYAFRLIHPLFDITPITMTLSLGIFAGAAFRYQFLGVLPGAYHQAVLTAEDPIFILDRRGNTVFENRAARNLKTPPGEGEISTRDGRTFALQDQRTRPGGRLLHYTDVTELNSLRRDLESRNLELEEAIGAVEEQSGKKKRLMETELINRSRRELHDILGHSLTQVMLLLRSGERLLSKDPEAGRLRWNQAKEETLRSLEELGRSLSGRKREIQSLSGELDKIVIGFARMEVEVELAVCGEERSLPPAVVGELYRCCQESITNAVKHGGAEKIFLGLYYQSRGLTVVVVNNGRGCPDPKPGNGLSMMKDRMRKLGGELHILSGEGEGFQVSLTLAYTAIPEANPSVKAGEIMK